LSVPGLAWLFDCRNTATALLKKRKMLFMYVTAQRIFLFFAVLGGV
jgi:hypothetical protein